MSFRYIHAEVYGIGTIKLKKNTPINCEFTFFRVKDVTYDAVFDSEGEPFLFVPRLKYKLFLNPCFGHQNEHWPLSLISDQFGPGLL